MRQWTRHYQDFWEERSGAVNLPKWLRVVALAYGMHRANGHACFARGEMALVLGKVDERTGELVPEPNVSRSIKTAVDNGFLAPGSTTRCLVVPLHAISGPLGNPNARCPIHGRPVVSR